MFPTARKFRDNVRSEDNLKQTEENSSNMQSTIKDGTQATDQTKQLHSQI